MVLESVLYAPAMDELFGDAALIQAMFDFEAALVRAQAELGLIPETSARSIASLCRAELYDVPALVKAAGTAGTVAIPLVRRLIENVSLFDPVAAAFVHQGATSQDVIDTALVLQTRKALRLIEADLLRLCGRLLALADAHKGQPLLARTLMQPALVTGWRCKILQWLQPLLRSAAELRRQADAALRLQLGGAAGTLATLGQHADAVCHQVSAQLQLPLSNGPWHVQRDRWVRLGAELGVLCGSLGKIGRDLALMSQAEVGELAEGQTPGRGGSSAMPQKRNPVGAMVALAAAQRAPHRVACLLSCMVQEQERALGGWQAEQAEWSGLLLSCHGSVHALADAFEHLQVFPARMLENIDAQQDLVFAEGLRQLLTRELGRPVGEEAIAELIAGVQAGRGPLRLLAQELLRRLGHLPGRVAPADLEMLFDVHATARAAEARLQPWLQQARGEFKSLQQGGGPGHEG
ncbi:lyase family protein [Pelomonas sp. SE-A7]|uniref:lyase family protein n=1 Tax=Pelomonas sp. SE-A7 TaxID=3054953 RepID=UPI00259CCBBE|nr:lyase family protein [Pelomonas sp. SE-A7]MDM4767337.1 lyase family protein [Pelomonas sp. SE-A7]